MICLGNTFEDLAFRTTVYNTVRNINDTPPPPPPDEYSNEDAVVESGLCDIFGPSFNDSRGTLITPFQCLDWGQPRSLAHHFHMGCIGAYAWKCCIASEFGRRDIEDVTCPLCSRRICGDIVLTARTSEPGSRFPFRGTLPSISPPGASSSNNIWAGGYSVSLAENSALTSSLSIRAENAFPNQQEDSQLALGLANEFPSIRQAILPRIPLNNVSFQNLQDYLHSQGIQYVPSQLFGVDFSSFPPQGFHLQQTYSWLYMPLILQAANRGIPVININITPQHQNIWDRWVQVLMSHSDLPPLQQLIPIFDGLLHLSANDQNIIISSASSLLGQEVQEFIGSLLALHNRQSHLGTPQHSSFRGTPERSPVSGCPGRRKLFPRNHWSCDTSACASSNHNL